MRFNIKNIILGSMLLAGEQLLAQAATAPAEQPASAQQFNQIMTLVLVVGAALVTIVALWALVRANNLMYRDILRQQSAIHGVNLEGAQSLSGAPQGDDFWTRLRKKYWEDAVPIEREQDIMLDHGYDGIRELDNSLPPWWINMFYLTIIWAFGYMIYYHWGGNGPSSTDEYKQEMEIAKKEVAMALAGKADAIDESSVTALTESAAISDGELIFKTNCAACHGQHGEGGVGPNFCDEYWLHGGGIKNVFKTIKYGVPEKGMIAWSSTLRPSDMQKVASYILKFQGTNPANPKAPQGDIWKPEGADAGAPATKDTTATAQPAPSK